MHEVARRMLPERRMSRLTVDGLRAMLPDLDELRPLVDHLLARSEADPGRAWSRSGMLGTTGDRLIDTAGLSDEARALAAREHEHAQRILALAARAVERRAEGASSEAASALLEAAALEEKRERAASAEAYANAAYRIARDQSEPRLTALALRRRARHRRSMGRLVEAEHDYREAAHVAQAGGDERGAAEAAIGAGNVREEQGHWNDAESWYRRALDELHGLEAPVPELWHALLNLHVVLRSRGEVEASVEPLERAERIARALGDGSAAQFIENARGQLGMAAGDFDAAELHLRRAIAASTSAWSEVTIRLNLAETLLAMGRHLDAAEQARRAEQRAIVARLPRKLPEAYRILGRIAAAEGTSDAFVLFERALGIITDRQLSELERAQTLQAYAAAEARVGDPRTAEELYAEADRSYRRLGVRHRRHEWSDRFDEEAHEHPDPNTWNES